MLMGLGGARWCRLLLIALLVLPIPAALGLDVDDGVIAVSDSAETDENRLRIVAGALSDPAWILPVSPSPRWVVSPDPQDPVVAGWTSLTPTDRAPPRA